MSIRKIIRNLNRWGSLAVLIAFFAGHGLALADTPYFSGYEVRSAKDYDKIKEAWLTYIGSDEKLERVNRGLACFIKFPNNGSITVGFQNTGKVPVIRNPFCPPGGLSIRLISEDDAIYEMRVRLPKTDPNADAEMIINPSDYRESSWPLTDASIQELIRRDDVKHISVRALQPTDPYWYELSKGSSPN